MMMRKTGVIGLHVLVLLLADGASVATGGRAFVDIPPHNTSGVISDDVTMRCDVTGQQEAADSLVWNKMAVHQDTGRWVVSLIISVNSLSRNQTKYEVDNRYRLRINHLGWEDEGAYECDMRGEHFQAFLLVIDPPESLLVSWSSNSSEVGENVTVRCDCGSSRPQPSLRWFRGFTDVTEWAHITLSQTDSQGYGEATSVLPVTLQQDDLDGMNYRCVADYPDYENLLYTDTNLYDSKGWSIAPEMKMTVLLLLMSMKSVFFF